MEIHITLPDWALIVLLIYFTISFIDNVLDIIETIKQIKHTKKQNDIRTRVNQGRM